ncbi:hypothetical protein GQR58_000091 [Nymphon striatum]|nr:hypothetical protein GQR58_000091 [Nymphon striatum]
MSPLSADGFDAADLSRNAFLGGKVSLLQPVKGYRAGVDPVLLAASVAAKSGQSVLDLGCGAGAALYCLAARVPDLSLWGLERQADYAELARQNAALNGWDARIITGDVADMPAPLKSQRFDHILTNPPYFDRSASTAASDAGREAAMGQDTGLDTWVSAASKRLAPRGMLHMVHRAERLPDILTGFCAHLGSVEVQPLSPRKSRAANLVLVRGRKGGRADFILHSPWVLHSGPRHTQDAESYVSQIRAVLRDGAELTFGGNPD